MDKEIIKIAVNFFRDILDLGVNTRVSLEELFNPKITETGNWRITLSFEETADTEMQTLLYGRKKSYREIEIDPVSREVVSMRSHENERN